MLASRNPFVGDNGYGKPIDVLTSSDADERDEKNL